MPAKATRDLDPSAPLRPSRSVIVFAIGAVLFGLAMSFGLALDDPRRRYPTFVGSWLTAHVGLLILLLSKPTGPRVTLAVGLGLALRAWALGLFPAFSEDMFRYVYEGRLALWAGPIFPFLHPPAAGPALGVPAALLDESWLRINHPEIATIYPPLAQAAFVASAFVGGLIGGAYAYALKLCLLAFDLLTWRLLHRRSPLSGLAFGLSPLVIYEVAREGHADALPAFGFLVYFLAATDGQALRAYLGLSVAALGKLVGLVLLPLALRVNREGARRVMPWLLVLVVLPYAATLGQETSGLFAYATRWRSGDGAFTLFLQLSGYALGGDWARLEVLGLSLTVTRQTLARLATGGIFLGLYAGLLARKEGHALGPSLGGTVLLLLLLLSPTLHPWYVLWLAPFACLGPFPGRWSAVWLMVSAVLLHHPGWLELESGVWREIGSLKALVHGPAWLLLVFDLGARWRLTLFEAAYCHPAVHGLFGKETRLPDPKPSPPRGRSLHRQP